MNRIEVMRQAVQKASQLLLQPLKDRSTAVKANANDFVTVADIKAQDLLRKYLNNATPGAIVVSEEDPEATRKQLGDPSFSGFVIDPIDGTYNFKRNMQESSISIGYIENGQPVAGVIYDPYKNELFEAEVGKGARCNGNQFMSATNKDWKEPALLPATATTTLRRCAI